MRAEDLKIVLQKMAKFNAWESRYNQSISRKDPADRQKRMEEFLILFDFASYYSDEVIKKAHQEHLDSLIESQRKLMMVG